METLPQLDTHRTPRTAALPGHIHHDSFATKSARHDFDPVDLLESLDDYDDHYMPDDVTRDHARRMHYAAYRMHQSRTRAELARWQGAYFGLRDRIVLGNRKLIYRAVRRRMALQNRADDLIGDCHIVLIQAVAAFNPWMGIRFSTYAFTCLVRALSRLSQKHSADWLTRSLSLDALPDGEPRGKANIPDSGASMIPIEEFLRDGHPLLNEREKRILSHRFNMRDDPSNPTLESVGRTMGLSKERVRQVQASALDKLRRALGATEPAGV